MFFCFYLHSLSAHVSILFAIFFLSAHRFKVVAGGDALDKEEEEEEEEEEEKEKSNIKRTEITPSVVFIVDRRSGGTGFFFRTGEGRLRYLDSNKSPSDPTIHQVNSSQTRLI